MNFSAEKRRSSDNGSKYLSWKWLAGVLLGVVFLLTGFFVGGGMSDSKVEMKEIKVIVATNCIRLTKIETNYEHITKSLERIEQKLIEQKLDEHTKVNKR
jgi:hypothetical protein